MAVFFKSSSKIKLYVLLFLGFLSLRLWAQPEFTRQEYIDKYAELAIEEMKRHKIPASITLAQALLESGNGNSTLAIKANNHFGIKCHDTWKGKTIRHDDDKKRECFRKYNTVLESYEDHSIFLVKTPRYKFLFGYKITDYKSWAIGLKKAGYATAKHYDKTLIEIIETYKLYKYDVLEEELAEPAVEMIGKRKIQYNNNVKYVIFGAGDNLTEIAKDLGRFKSELVKYNEIDESVRLSKGMYVYLQPKRNKYRKKDVYLIEKQDVTLWEVSQKFAVKIKKLKKYNEVEDAYSPLPVGKKLFLNSRAVKKSTLDVQNDEREIIENDDEVKQENLDNTQEEVKPKEQPESEFEFKLE